MKKNLIFNFLPTAFVFFATSIIWVIFNISNLEILYLLIGLILGHLFLDLDHIIYWFYRKPNTDESKIVQATIKNGDLKSFFKLVKAAKTSHVNLIFHHYFFQISLNLISFFIFISSSNTIILSFLLSINLHLLSDEIRDYFYNSKFLQKWLFAREDKQLSIKSIKNYLITFIFLFFLFFFLLVKSKT